MLSAFCYLSYSQSISVGSFKLLDSDLTANTTGTMELDQNGETAALIKVVTTQTGFTFDGGAMGVVKTKQTPGEIWVYVPRGSKKITIKHPQLGVLRDYYYPISIESARSYEMVLVSSTVQTLVKQTSNNQYLVLKVNPADAIVELNNEVLPTSNGIAQKLVKIGSYEYRVQAPDYHTIAGIVEVNDPQNKKIVEINLDPAYGWIEIPSHKEYDGAQVYIDNTLAGTMPMKSKKLPSGKHNIKIVKPLYNSYSQAVVVKDNETTQVAPTLSANYSEVIITTENDAEIYVNDEKKGRGSWTGKLGAGIYILEAKKDGHQDSKMTIDITPEGQIQKIQLPPPIPIYGILNITSNPPFSDVFIDEKKVGQTPLIINDVICCNHNIKISHHGFTDYHSNQSIIQGKENILNVTLTQDSNIEVRVTSEIKRPFNLYIDGEFKGIMDFWDSRKFILPSGKHVFEAIADWIGLAKPIYAAKVVENIQPKQVVTFKDTDIIKKRQKRK